MTETRLEDLEQEMINASDNYARIKELNEENNLKQPMKQTSRDGVSLRKLRNNKECNHARDFIALFWL